MFVPSAALFPEATITGTDLSPVQPNDVPENVYFLVDDAHRRRLDVGSESLRPSPPGKHGVIVLPPKRYHTHVAELLNKPLDDSRNILCMCTDHLVSVWLALPLNDSGHKAYFSIVASIPNASLAESESYGHPPRDCSRTYSKDISYYVNIYVWSLFCVAAAWH